MNSVDKTCATRTESDSIGTLEVPSEAYYGVQTLRGRNNFHITGRSVDTRFIKNIIKIKKAAAAANFKAGSINEEYKNAIVAACDEALSGKFDEWFVTDCIQGGAGTTANMNVNEVIANRATELLGGKKGEYLCHPNDHVNRSQSTNDVIPTAGKLTVLELADELSDATNELIRALDEKAEQFNDVIKMGRTQLEDAVPIRLGQEFAAYSSVIKRCLKLFMQATEEMRSLNIGGTAIGTAINVKRKYLNEIIPSLKKITGFELYRAENLIDATQNLDGFVHVSGALKTMAVSLSKICNDLRLMSSGPKTGLEEIILPAMQNGSSIMPGKVNPTQCEAVTMVAIQVMGADATIGIGASQGNFELNVFMPVIIHNFLQSVRNLADAIVSFDIHCASGIRANKEKMNHNLYNSLMLVTALNPYIGYENSAKTAKKAYKENISLKEACVALGFMTAEEFDKVFRPEEMAYPHK